MSLTAVLGVLLRRRESICPRNQRPLARCRWDVTSGLQLGDVIMTFSGVGQKLTINIGTIQSGADFPSGGRPQDVGPSDGIGERILKRPGAEICGSYYNIFFG
jgi:hypothetical protein